MQKHRIAVFPIAAEEQWLSFVARQPDGLMVSCLLCLSRLASQPRMSYHGYRDDSVWWVVLGRRWAGGM